MEPRGARTLRAVPVLTPASGITEIPEASSRSRQKLALHFPHRKR
jgi:hypothetical protein